MADDSNKGALINIEMGDLGGAAKSLVEKVAAGCGALYEPKRIVRKAKAEAEADKIKALSKLDVEDLERRALQRFIHEETKKQENIEAITEKALEFLPDSAHPENIEDDWMARFLDKGKLVSDKEMQELWAKVLAGEATAAGRFSKRTLELLHSLSKKDAAHVVNLFRFVWQQLVAVTPSLRMGNLSLPTKLEDMDMIFKPVALLFDVNAPLCTQYGINFPVLQHLETIGIIKFEHLTGFQIGNIPLLIYCYPNKKSLTVKPKEGGFLPLGKVMLTESGEELLHLCGITKTEGVWELVKQHWENNGMIVSVSDTDYLASNKK